MKHNWTSFERGSWCKQCGTYRTILQHDPDTNMLFYWYHEVASDEPRKVPEAEGDWSCPMMPRGYRNAISRWAETCEEWGRAARVDVTNINHSALLQRLLAGKVVHPEPPPLAYSYPNYSLLDEGWCEPVEVWHPAKMGIETNSLGPDTLLVDQHRWRIIETLGEEDWVVTYLIPDREAIDKARFSGKPMRHVERSVLSKTRWHLRCIGSRIYFNPRGERVRTEGDTKLTTWWRIDRLADAT